MTWNSLLDTASLSWRLGSLPMVLPNSSPLHQQDPLLDTKWKWVFFFLYKWHQLTLIASYLGLLFNNHIPSQMLTPQHGHPMMGMEATVAEAVVISFESASFCPSNALSSSNHKASIYPIIMYHLTVPLAFATCSITPLSLSSSTATSLPFPGVELILDVGLACWLMLLPSVTWCHEPRYVTVQAQQFNFNLLSLFPCFLSLTVHVSGAVTSTLSSVLRGMCIGVQEWQLLAVQMGVGWYGSVLPCWL